MKIVITGAAGQLSGALLQELAGAHDVVGLTRAELDLTRHGDVLSAMERLAPDVIVNGSAYNAVDRAEEEPSAALAVNTFAVRSLSRAAARCGALLVHYSTDFVFSGDASTPYTEDDEPGPLSVYGQSKLLGEWFAADAPRVFVLRVESLFGGPNAHSSIDRILQALVEGREVRAFADRVASPSYVQDVATATHRLIAAHAEGGLYHCVNDGYATWDGIAREAARLLGCSPRIVPVQIVDMPLRAKRPRFCALSNAKLAAAGVSMPTWQDALARHIARLQHRGQP
jgi:dTDP-4-dehydrorhamnose reductase